MIRVLLVDDQALVHGGLRLILEGQDDIEVVGEAENGTEAVRLARVTAPDVVLKDIRMPVMTQPPQPRGTPERLAGLTSRVDVLRLLARGLSNDEIAERLIIGRATVKTHVVGILAKLGMRDRTQAAVLCYELGWVRAGGPDQLP